MGDADFWELLTKSGISPDSATAIVNSHRGMGDADLWERLVQNGAAPDAATGIVKSRTPQPDTGLSGRNVGRSLVQGATLGWGDELGLTSRPNEAAFKAAHPVVDFLAKMGGGLAAPIAAVAAAPELATTLGGAALLGGATGAVAGAGEADPGNRLRSAATGGLLGAAGGAAGYGIAKGAGAIAGTIADRMHPERGVAKAAANLLNPDVSARLAAVDQIAPGGASLATTNVPAEGAKVSRFLPMLRAVGANPEAAAGAESSISAQTAALDAARKGLGSKMDALGGEVQITPEIRSVLSKVRTALGAKTPNVPAAELQDVNPLGLEKSTPFAFDEDAKTLDIQQLRDALSRLRFLSRGNVKRGLEANGIDTRDIGIARAALQSYLYDVKPDFASLDRNYAAASNTMRQADKALKTVQASRGNYGANEAYRATAGSLGGSLPRGTHGVVMTALDKILTNRAGAADAVNRLIVSPGGAEAVNRLLSALPQTTPAGRYATPLTAAAIPAMRGLLSPQQSP